mmetsp:Transcript_17742/g.67015  ORF Transcript_17742/g.67015 Transcript_17742/m.67015 type:complete len:284 (+) Transcript_17742:1079-1930(+)
MSGSTRVVAPDSLSVTWVVYSSSAQRLKSMNEQNCGQRRPTLVPHGSNRLFATEQSRTAVSNAHSTRKYLRSVPGSGSLMGESSTHSSVAASHLEPRCQASESPYLASAAKEQVRTRPAVVTPSSSSASVMTWDFSPVHSQARYTSSASLYCGLQKHTPRSSASTTSRHLWSRAHLLLMSSARLTGPDFTSPVCGSVNSRTTVCDSTPGAMASKQRWSCALTLTGSRLPGRYLFRCTMGVKGLTSLVERRRRMASFARRPKMGSAVPVGQKYPAAHCSWKRFK